jgi:hypothetical protein
LKQARSTLDGWVNVLDERGIAPEKRRSDPKWRTLNARCTQLNVRLKAIDAGIVLDEELKRRKAEKAAAAQAEVAEEPKQTAKKGKGSSGKKPAAEAKKKKPPAEKKPGSGKKE